MPHLDADALTSDDPKGLEFLASVLEVPAEHPAPVWARPATLRKRPVVASAARGAPRRRKTAKDPLAEPA